MERRRIATAVSLILLAAPAFAQTTGDITGRVTDAQGVALNGVTVRAQNAETGVKRDTQSDRGIYRLAGLPIGTYQVIAEAQGMRPFTESGVILNVGRNVALDIQMQVSGINEKVTVTGINRLVSPRSSAVGEVVDLARIERL